MPAIRPKSNQIGSSTSPESVMFPKEKKTNEVTPNQMKERLWHENRIGLRLTRPQFWGLVAMSCTIVLFPVAIILACVLSYINKKKADNLKAEAVEIPPKISDVTVSRESHQGFNQGDFALSLLKPKSDETEYLQQSKNPKIKEIEDFIDDFSKKFIEPLENDVSFNISTTQLETIKSKIHNYRSWLHDNKQNIKDTDHNEIMHLLTVLEDFLNGYRDVLNNDTIIYTGSKESTMLIISLLYNKCILTRELEPKQGENWSKRSFANNDIEALQYYCKQVNKLVNQIRSSIEELDEEDQKFLDTALAMVDSVNNKVLKRYNKS